MPGLFATIHGLLGSYSELYPPLQRDLEQSHLGRLG
jgi:hypothetical protein